MCFVISKPFSLKKEKEIHNSRKNFIYYKTTLLHCILRLQLSNSSSIFYKFFNNDPNFKTIETGLPLWRIRSITDISVYISAVCKKIHVGLQCPGPHTPFKWINHFLITSNFVISYHSHSYHRFSSLTNNSSTT